MPVTTNPIDPTQAYTTIGSEPTRVTLERVEIVDASGAQTGISTNPLVISVNSGTAYTTPTHTAVNVTTASAQVLAANTARLYLLMQNDSDTVMYFKLNAAAVVNAGIRLAPGDSYEMSGPLGNLYTGLIRGIHGGTGNKVLLLTEGT